MTTREFKERYLFHPKQDLIAEGTYSRVYRATDLLLQRDICIKLFRRELLAGSPLIRELSRAGVFFHPNICAFYDLVEIEETNALGEAGTQPIAILEYMNGGTITAYTGKHKPHAAQLQKLVKDILKGLQYLHAMGRPHLDIKPGNLLIKLTAQEPIAKVADFLNSENLHTQRLPVAIDPQQLCYRAPECFESSYGGQHIGADIWSLGVVVYELVTGKKLFWNQGDTIEKTIRNICYTDYWPQVYNLPEPYRAFVKKCLVRSTSERTVTLEELTLTLDGFTTEVQPPVVLQTSPAAIAAEMVVEKIEAAAPVIIASPVKASPAQQAQPELLSIDEVIEERGGSGVGWVGVMAVLSMLIILVGVSAFIWQINDDNRAIAIAINDAPKPIIKHDTIQLAAIIPAKIDTDTATICVEPEVKAPQDTVRFVPIQQKPAPIAIAAKPRTVATAPPYKETNGIQVKVKVMPMLPYFDYLWVDKPYYFDLGTPLMSDDEYDLYCEDAAITALGKNTFYVKPTKMGNINIMILEKEQHNKIAEKSYIVKNRSVPVATIGDDITGGFVSPKMLLAKLAMKAKSANGSYKIKSFHMSCLSGACDIRDVSNNGVFNESMVRFLNKVTPGEKLYFDNIIAEDESGNAVKLDPFQITTY